MKKLNNIQFANVIVNETKMDFKKNPSQNKFEFKINTEILSEQFNERVFENIFCTEVKCSIEIIKIHQEVYRIKGSLYTISFKNGSMLRLENAFSENSGRGATPLSNWDYLNK